MTESFRHVPTNGYAKRPAFAYQLYSVTSCSTRTARADPRILDRDRLIAVTLAPPPKKCGVTHWSSRLLVSHLGSGTGRWPECGVSPDRHPTPWGIAH